MDLDRWRRIEETFHSALECRQELRSSVLAQACAGDEALLSEVEALLAAHDAAGGFIEASALEDAAALAPKIREEPMPGRRVGSYKIIREIAQGGMGSVYLAVRDDEQYQKCVAIKIVKRGMDTDLILRQFRSERQILASLDHPNIGRLYDAGTTDDGRSYFVMEYIEGRPIHEHCNALRLDIEGRLTLFGSVCSAVHYAHQNLVIHRDIKPSNILVTAEGVVKLLDFGIAKLLSPDPSEPRIETTASALRLMTPEYASPEQARGDPVTTATDVYSLGVLLYEMVTGHRPYKVTSRAPLELVRTICEQRPEKPSAAVTRIEDGDGQGLLKITPESVSKARAADPAKLRRRLRGDLDNIILKAIYKDSRLRYTSVQQFSEDIGRHLAGMPVIARSDTLVYRSRKFIQRHRIGVAAAVLIALSLVGGIAATTWEARRAQRRFDEVRKLANSLLWPLHDAIGDLPGSTAARQLLVKTALEYLDSLAREAGDDPTLQAELASAYERVGEVQGGVLAANLGNTAEAMESYRKALTIREALVAANPSNQALNRALSLSYRSQADIRLARGDYAGALESLRKTLAILEPLAAADPRNAGLKRDLAVTYHASGTANIDVGDIKLALANRRKALTIFQALAEAEPASARAQRDYALECKNLGATLEQSGDSATALNYYYSAVRQDEARVKANAHNAQARLDLSFSYGSVGAALAGIGDTTGALRNYGKALTLREEISAADPKDAWARGSVAYAHTKIGWVLELAKDYHGALPHYRNALEIREELAKKDSANVFARLKTYEARTAIGNLLSSSGDPAGALRAFQDSLSYCQALAAEFPSNLEVLRINADAYWNLGEVRRRVAENLKNPPDKRRAAWREGLNLYQRCLEIWLQIKKEGRLRPADKALPGAVIQAVNKCKSGLSDEAAGRF